MNSGEEQWQNERHVDDGGSHEHCHQSDSERGISSHKPHEFWKYGAPLAVPNNSTAKAHD